ncbi:hypothetical protein Tco_0502271, partial [Tanacetum coccineum]
MSNMSKDIQYAGFDTRPPMLDRTDFESWQQRIRLYCLGKDNRENIMKSITEGPFQMGTVRDTLTEGGEGVLHLGPVRATVFADLSAEQKDRYKADIRAINIILQGIPKDIYSLINHYTDAKDIWDNVKMILEGSELTKDDQESQLYDEFKHFCQIKGETIHVYYGESLNETRCKAHSVQEFGKFTSREGESMESYYSRFYKLMNELTRNNLQVTTMQVNVQFLQQLQPEWSRFVTVYQNEVNDIRAERIAKSANPLALLATTSASTRHKGKEIAKPVTPQSESVSEEDNKLRGIRICKRIWHSLQ